MNVTQINKLGKELELYTYIDYIGKGFPIILPKGAKLINLIRNYVESEESKYGYAFVRTPSVSRAEIYKIEDRLEHEKREMFIIESDDEEEDKREENSIVLRPYVAPFHCSIYKTKQRSYKSLPVKYSETSTVYRNERDIKGIRRTRQITLSDASIFVVPNQLEEEIVESLKIQQNFISKLGLEVKYIVSNWDDTKKENYIGTIQEWENAVKAMKSALKSLNIPFEQNNKARMQGPSIQIMYEGKDFSSMQIDFEIVHRFDLTYVDKNNEEKFPIYMHRTSVGSYENLLGILIEKYQGEFPLWMAPVQVVIITEGEEYNDYSKEIKDKLLENGIRVEEDKSDTNVQNKEYRAIEQKVPYIITISKKELNSKRIKVRNSENTRIMEIENLIREVLNCQTNY